MIRRRYAPLDDCVLFLGAGASKPFDIPDTGELGDMAFGILQESFSSTETAEIQKALHESGYPDIEGLLEFLMSLQDPKKGVKRAGPFAALLAKFAKDEIRKFERSECQTLIERIKDIIRKRCFPPRSKVMGKIDKDYTHLFCEISRSRGYNADTDILSVPRRVYTTNYDCCFDWYCELIGISFKIRDGFTPARFPEFDPFIFSEETGAAYDLIKLHGGVNWALLEGRATIAGLPLRVTRTDQPLKPGDDFYAGTVVKEMMIYPTREKPYLKFPWYELLNVLRKEPREKWVVVGYSFRDEAVNAAFLDLAKAGKIKQMILIDPDREIGKRPPLSQISELGIKIAHIPMRYENATIGEYIRI